MSPETWSMIGIAVAVVVLIIMAMRGVSILLIAPLCSVIVAVFSGFTVLDTLTKNYLNGLASFPAKFFFILMLGSVFGKYVDDSGAARSITRGILRLVGHRQPMWVMFAIVVVCGLLSYTGVSNFVIVFALMPIARGLFQELDIPWAMFPALYFLGTGSFSTGGAPGSVQMHNLIPTKYLGTTPMAGVEIGLIATTVTIGVGFFFLHRHLVGARRKGIGYKAPIQIMQEDRNRDGEKTPNIWLCLVPSLVLVGLLNVVGLDVVYALVAGSITAALLFRCYIKDQNRTMSSGALNSVVPLINTSAVVGFGTVVAAVPGFSIMTAGLMNSAWHPAVSVALITTIVAAVTGSASGGLTIAMETMSKTFLATGLAPEAIHRLATIACTALVLPSNGITITILSLSGLTHREGYWVMFKVYAVSQLVALAVAVLVAVLQS